jgi:hypothetical protein
LSLPISRCQELVRWGRSSEAETGPRRTPAPRESDTRRDTRPPFRTGREAVATAAPARAIASGANHWRFGGTAGSLLRPQRNDAAGAPLAWREYWGCNWDSEQVGLLVITQQAYHRANWPILQELQGERRDSNPRPPGPQLRTPPALQRSKAGLRSLEDPSVTLGYSGVLGTGSAPSPKLRHDSKPAPANQAVGAPGHPDTDSHEIRPVIQARA